MIGDALSLGANFHVNEPLKKVLKDGLYYLQQVWKTLVIFPGFSKGRYIIVYFLFYFLHTKLCIFVLLCYHKQSAKDPVVCSCLHSFLSSIIVHKTVHKKVKCISLPKMMFKISSFTEATLASSRDICVSILTIMEMINSVKVCSLLKILKSHYYQSGGRKITYKILK